MSFDLPHRLARSTSRRAAPRTRSGTRRPPRSASTGAGLAVLLAVVAVALGLAPAPPHAALPSGTEPGTVGARSALPIQQAPRGPDLGSRPDARLDALRRLAGAAAGGSDARAAALGTSVAAGGAATTASRSAGPAGPPADARALWLRYGSLRLGGG